MPVVNTQHLYTNELYTKTSKVVSGPIDNSMSCRNMTIITTTLNSIDENVSIKAI